MIGLAKIKSTKIKKNAKRKSAQILKGDLKRGHDGNYYGYGWKDVNLIYINFSTLGVLVHLYVTLLMKYISCYSPFFSFIKIQFTTS